MREWVLSLKFPTITFKNNSSKSILMAHLIIAKNAEYHQYPLTGYGQYLLIYATFTNGCYDRAYFEHMLQEIKLPCNEPSQTIAAFNVEREFMIHFAQRDKVVYIHGLPTKPSLEDLFSEEQNITIH